MNIEVCPFCQNKDQTAFNVTYKDVSEETTNTVGYLCTIQCRKCGASIHQLHSNKNDALTYCLDKWNRSYRQGRWIPFGNNGIEYTDRWQCSNCLRTVMSETWGKQCEYKYCPHCQSIMKGN